jgi:hypothetical protein
MERAKFTESAGYTSHHQPNRVQDAKSAARSSGLPAGSRAAGPVRPRAVPVGRRRPRSALKSFSAPDRASSAPWSPRTVAELAIPLRGPPARLLEYSRMFSLGSGICRTTVLTSLTTMTWMRQARNCLRRLCLLRCYRSLDIDNGIRGAGGRYSRLEDIAMSDN